MVTLALHTGMRPGEVCALRWAWINFPERLITIPAECSKNGKAGMVPMNTTVVKLLADPRPTPAAEGSVFSVTQIRSSFRRVANRAGLRDASFHVCRHTFATRLIVAGVPLATVKELLRHADVKMTMRYTHVQLHHLYSAVERLTEGSEPTAESITA
jgi:integrase